MMIPPLSPAERHFNGPALEPRRFTVVLGELTVAPNVISVVVFGHTSKDAYTD